MKKVFLIHGYGGEPNGGWRPWLMGELAKESIWACALAMPMVDIKPIKDEWVRELSRSIGSPNEEVFIVGHSLGVPAVLRYVESLPKGSVLGGLILASGFTHALEKDKYRALDNFVDKPFDFEHIKNVCKKFSVIHGDNDTAVPFAEAEELSSNLSCELISVPNGAHLSDGCYELPQALEALKKMF